MSRQTGASNSLMTLDKRSKIMLMALAVILVIAAVYFLVLKKSSSSDSNAGGVVPKPSAAASVAPKASAAPKVKPLPSAAPIVATDSTRDPFQPLIQEAAATSSTSPGATSSPAAPSSAPSSSPSSTPAGHTVGLLGLSGATASVSYDNGAAKSVRAGSTIATGITVEKVDSDSIFIKYANQAYSLTLGQTVTLSSS